MTTIEVRNVFLLAEANPPASVSGWLCFGFFIALLVVIAILADSSGKKTKGGGIGGVIILPAPKKKDEKSIGEIIFCVLGFTIAAFLVIGLVITLLPYILGAIAIGVLIWIVVTAISTKSESGSTS